MIFSIKVFKKVSLLLYSAILFFVAASPVFADMATTLHAPRMPRVNEVFALDVLVDPSEDAINSVDISVRFSPETYIFKGYQQDEGAISIWVSAPSEREKGVVQFSGVIPGGVERIYDPMHPEEKAVPLARLLFMPIAEGEASFSITNATLLRNDGQGTQIAARLDTISTNVAPSSNRDFVAVVDTVPPTQFSIERIPGSPLGGTPDMIVFEATDTQSGIARYEISYDGETFRQAQSPYVIPRRLFPYTLTARAIDFAGNYSDAALFVPGAGSAPYLLLIALGGAIAIVVYIRRWRRKKV